MEVVCNFKVARKNIFKIRNAFFNWSKILFLDQFKIFFLVFEQLFYRQN